MTRCVAPPFRRQGPTLEAYAENGFINNWHNKMDELLHIAVDAFVDYMNETAHTEALAELETQSGEGEIKKKEFSREWKALIWSLEI